MTDLIAQTRAISAHINLSLSHFPECPHETYSTHHIPD